MPVPRTHRIVRGQAVLDIIEEGPAGAPCITCLHALATDLHLWDDQAPALTQSHRVLRLDMRGHGGSSVGDTSYSIDELALDVVAVWDSLGIERSTVLGLSIGGMIGMALARVTIPTWLSEATRATRPDIVARVDAMIRRTAPDGYRAATAALRGLALRPRLPQLSIPTLFLVGSRDGAHPDVMRDMAAAVPGSRLVEIEGAAHLANLECPDAFTAAVLAFGVL